MKGQTVNPRPDKQDLMRCLLASDTGDANSKDAIGEVLEAIIELGGEGVKGGLHQVIHQQLQLLLCHVHVEALTECPYCAHPFAEAWQLGT